MAKHVRVNRKGEACARAEALDEPVDGVGRERATALGGEHASLSGNCRRSSRSARTSSPLIARPSPTMARVGDVVLLDHPADITGPRSISAYLVEVQDFTAAALVGEGRKFKLDPQRLLDSLQWKHNAAPPDLHLQVVRDPALWLDFVGATLFDALDKHDSRLFDALRSDAPLP
jgi:hypothetical protein